MKIKPSGGTFTGDVQWFNSDEKAWCSVDDIAKPGDEIWLVIEINGGDTKSCRKSSRLYYKRHLRNKATFTSGGTTFNNNRCKKRGIVQDN